MLTSLLDCFTRGLVKRVFVDLLVVVIVMCLVVAGSVICVDYVTF